MNPVAGSFSGPLGLTLGVPSTPTRETADISATRVGGLDTSGITQLRRKVRGAAAQFRPMERQPVMRYRQPITLTVLLLPGAGFVSLLLH